MKAAIFCGDRNWTDTAAIAKAFDRFRPDVVIEGEAPGADRLSRREAELRGWRIAKEGELIMGRTIVPVPAEWKRYGKGAGPKRNARMLEILVALRNIRPRGLTASCADCEPGEIHTTKSRHPFRAKEPWGIFVVAFHADLENSRGTANMVAQAKAAGVRVEVETGENP